MQIRPITGTELAELPGRSAATGGSYLVVTPRATHDIRNLGGFVAEENGRLLGAVTHAIDGHSCEIVTIDAFEEERGVGTAMLDAVKDLARTRECDRIDLFTTNDNMHARNFYERRGFRLMNFYPDGMDLVRKVKPGIPHRGIDGIPLRDMIRYELRIT